MKKIYLLLIFLGIYGASFAQLSPYCNTEVFHLGDTTQTASSIFLTIEQDTGNTMKITMESANADPIDDIIIPGFATGFDTISPGKYSKTLSFISPPANVSLQVLWSKVSSPGNWQLSPTNISIPFTANCAGTPPPSAQTSKYCNTQVFHFGNPAEVASAINLSVGNLNSNSMKVVITSSNTDPVDDLVVAGGSGATISAIDNSIPGEMSRTLTWTTPPVEVVFNVIWSKVSSPGNWQLISGSASDTVPFIDTCGTLVTTPPTPSKAQISLPISWNDTANVDYTVTDFDGTASVLAADPMNASNLVLKTTRNIAGQIWQGTTLSTPAGLASAIPFTATDQIIKAVVYSPAIGKTINLKVENSANGGINSEVTTVTSVANAWDTLTFDFSLATSSINLSNTYDKVSIFYDFLTTPASALDYYLDDIFFAASGTPPPPPTPVYSQYCNSQIFHFGNPAEVASEANLTISNVDPSTVKFTISSANADPVDDLIINNTSGGVPSALDTSVAGEISRNLVWTSAPNVVKFNLLWSKVSFAGNWQLITGANNDSILFADTCGAVAPPPPPAKAQIDLPITWNDTANVDYTVTDFAGTASILVADPINANNIVLKTDKSASGQPWQGTTLSTPTGLANALPFAVGATTISAVIYSPDSGTVIRLKVEDAADPNINAEVDVVTSVANAWDTLVFDFATPVGAALNFSNTYDKVTIFYGFLATPAAKTYYVDDVFFGSGTVTPPPPSKMPSNLPITWNDTANLDYSVTDFDGTSSILMADPMNSSNIVLRTTRNTTGQPWQGTTISNPTGLASPIPFTQGSNTISAIVYSPNVGTTIRLKVEELGNGANVYSEVDVVTTVANAWDTLIFDFNNPTSGLPVNTNNTYNVISIFYDFLGTPTSAQDYYLDDVFFGGFIAPPPPPLKAKIDLPVNWDDSANVDYSVTDYNGNASALVTDPTNSGNTVLSTTKTSASQPWAGTTLGTSSGFATPIPFSAGNTTISARIWSPDAGIQVRLKAENQFVGSISVETEATTTVAGDWDTLYFDFNNNVFLTPALDTNQNYELLTVFYDFNVAPATPAKTYYIDDVFMGGPSIAPPVVKNVTFKVDLSNYSGPAYTNVNLNGSFNNWCGGCAVMTDANNDTIYEITIPLADDSVEYKFTLDGWNVDEQLTPGSICTKTTSGFTNRFLKLTGDTVLPEVCWQSCGVCTSTPVGPSTKNITFQVDMNDYTGTFTTVHVNGTFNNWCGACNPMTDANNDGVWEVTLPLAIDSIEYKFTVDGWTDDEKFAGGEPCTKTVGGFTNRFLIATGDVTLPVVCWASCSACTGAPSGTNITFKVDMNDYTSPFDTAYVNGTFNNWCGKCNPMTDANNDGVWELTINLPQDSIEFKYTVDGWDDDEKFLGGESCTKTVGGFTNRILRLNGDTVLPELCWGSCAACTGTPTIAQVRFAVDLSQYPDTFTTAYVNGEFNGWCGKCNPLSDADGDSIWEVTITLPIGDTVQFKYTLNGWQTQEILDPNYPCVLNVFNFTNRILAIEGDTNLGDLCWESCWECEPVGLTEGNQPNYFVVAPNPSNGNFVLDFSIPKADNIEVQLLNITGQTINAWRYNSNQVYQQINIDGSSNGIYFLKVQTPDYVGMKKIIISK